MISTTWNTESIWLWPYAANWAKYPKSTFEILSRADASLNGKEERSAQGESLRVPSFKFLTRLENGQPAELKNALKIQTTERIAVPFWPCAKPQADFAAAKIKGGVNISYQVNDRYQPTFSSWEIHTGDSPSGGYGADANTWTAPLLFCAFDKRPNPRLLTDEAQDLEVAFEEDSTVAEALVVAAGSYTEGPDAIDIFPAKPNFNRPVASGGTVVDVKAKAGGQRRELSKTWHGESPYRFSKFPYTLRSETEVANVLRFFQDKKALTGTFWVPGYVSEARLAEDIAQDADRFAVESTDRLGTEDFFMLYDKQNEQVFERTGTDGSDLIVDGTLNAFLRNETSLCSAFLARFAKYRMTFTWRTNEKVWVDIEFKELVPEYDNADPDVGEQETEGSFYTLTYGDEEPECLTSYERDIAFDGEDYISKDITHGPILRTITLEDKVELDAKYEDGTLAARLLHHKIPKLYVTIRKAIIDGATADDEWTVFTGQLTARLRGDRLILDGSNVGKDLDYMVPRQHFMKTCEHNLFGVGCGLDVADWTFSAEMADVGTEGYPYTFVIDTVTRDNMASLPGAMSVMDFFGNGYIIIAGEKIRIKTSTALSGGEITIILERDPTSFPDNGDTLKLVPSCDKQLRTCKAYHASNNPLGKFDNDDNFGGSHVAAQNLALFKLSDSNNGGKK